jgi:hypothetical protein
MTKTFLVIAAAIWVVLSYLACSRPTGSAVLLKDAWENGLVSVTFAAKDAGENLEVIAKRMSSKPLRLKVERGETKFEAGQESIAILTDKALEIDLSKKEEGSFIVRQTGNTRITAGSVTWFRQPKEDTAKD